MTRLFPFAALFLLAACWTEDAEVRTLDMAPNETASIPLDSETPVWVHFEAPKETDFDTLAAGCPVLEDGASDQPMCAEIRQTLPDGQMVSLVRGVIGAGMKFTPIDGRIELAFTSYADRPLTYEIRIER